MSGKLRLSSPASAVVLATALAVIFAGEAHAAGLKAIIITRPPTGPGIVPVGDPVYIYNFAAYLQPGYQLEFFDSIVVESVVGVPLNAGTSSPTYPTTGSPLSGTGWSAEESVPISPRPPTATWPAGSPPPTVPVSDVTFTFVKKAANGAPVSVADTTGAEPLFLGIFQIHTLNLPALRPGYSFDIHYVIHAHDLAGNEVTTDGFVTLATVPEPCSLMLMALGVAAPAAWAARRRRRAAA